MAIDDTKARAKEKDDKELTLEDRMLRFQERQLEIQERQVAAQEAALSVQKAQVKQTAPKSNQSVPKCSVFNPRGEKDYPMPALQCEIEIGYVQSPALHGFDREEVELVNLLTPRESQIELNDGSVVPVFIVGEKNSITGKYEKLAIRGMRDPDTGKYMALFTHSNKQQFPALKNFLRQILGEQADGVMTMKEEGRRIALPVEDVKHLPISVGA